MRSICPGGARQGTAIDAESLLPFLIRAALFATVLVSLSALPCSAGAGSPDHASERKTVFAVVPPDSPPTYYRDKESGKPAGFAVEVMDAIAERAGLQVEYVFEDGWSDIIEMVKSGRADLAPGMGVSRERRKDLAFTEVIDAFPISFFVRAEHAGIENAPGVHAVGVIKGSVAYEYLKESARRSAWCSMRDFRRDCSICWPEGSRPLPAPHRRSGSWHGRPASTITLRLWTSRLLRYREPWLCAWITGLCWSA